MRPLDLIVVHCSATRPTQDVGVAEIRKWHLDRGFADIGYHYVIRRDGRVEDGRPVEKAGAHAEGHNARSIGVCLAGGLDAKGKPAPEFAPAQIESLAGLLRRLKADYSITEILGHRDLPDVAKACPSFDVRHWLATGELKP